MTPLGEETVAASTSDPVKARIVNTVLENMMRAISVDVFDEAGRVVDKGEYCTVIWSKLYINLPSDSLDNPRFRATDAETDASSLIWFRSHQYSTSRGHLSVRICFRSIMADPGRRISVIV